MRGKKAKAIRRWIETIPRKSTRNVALPDATVHLVEMNHPTKLGVDGLPEKVRVPVVNPTMRSPNNAVSLYKQAKREFRKAAPDVQRFLIPEFGKPLGVVRHG